MAISDSQKVDYLWKKLGYSAAKTDTNANKKAPNEAISSPLQMRGDKVMKDAGSIPSTQPSSSAGVLTVYSTSSPIECNEDITSTANRTWKTGQTDWVSPEFGSTYQVKVYIHTSGDSAGASGGTQVFATGSGNSDEWFFDYQSGTLHFIGSNLPNGVSFTGKSVYIAGSRYTGEFGVGGDLGDFVFTNNEMAVGAGDAVVVDATTGLVIPVGTTAQRPSTPSNGTLRFNSSTGSAEVYNGSSWKTVGDTLASITTQTINGDGSSTSFTLSQTASANSIIVSINGVVQVPNSGYSVSGTTITMAEAMASTDVMEVRYISNLTVVTEITNASGTTSFTVNGTTASITIDNSTIAEITSNEIFNISNAHSLQLPVYTVAQANALSNKTTGQVIYVSNGDGGNPTLAVYNGSDWKAVALGSTISAV